MPNRDWGKIVIRRSLLNTGETGDIEFGHIPSAIARDMGISQVQVSRLESRILQRMRRMAEG